MALLVTVPEVQDVLGNTSSDNNAVLQLYLDRVESQLAELTGQYFEAGGTVLTDQPYDGTGTDFLWLHRKPASIDADIKVGKDPSDPDDTIDSTEILIDADFWRIRWTDGVFTRGERNIWVSFTTAENLPADDARAGIIEEVVRRFRLKGKEHLRGETFLELGKVDLLTQRANRDSFWEETVRKLDRRAHV